MFDDYKCPGKLPDSFKEAVSIEAQRIFDTCSERDCIPDLQVVLDSSCELKDSMTVVKTRCVEVSNVCISVDCVPFKAGYYAVDITYTFRIIMDAYENTCTDECITLKGSAVWNKRVILFGSKGNIKSFSSDDEVIGETDKCCKIVNMPKVTVSVVEPIALETKIECVKAMDGCDCTKVRGIVITLGLFSVVRLTRPVSILIPTYDYCIPDKECCNPAESPKEVFGKIDFPTEEFFPASCPMPTADIPPAAEKCFEFPGENCDS